MYILRIPIVHGNVFKSKRVECKCSLEQWKILGNPSSNLKE